MRRFPLAIAATTLALVLAGCGDDEPSPSSAEPTPGATASSSEEVTPSSEAPSTSSGIGGGAAESETVTPTPTPEPTTPTAPASPTSTPEPTQVPPRKGPPRTYEEALALFDNASGSQKFSRFASPSGNLYCVLDSPYLPPSCELGTGAVPDPAACPADGPSQNVGRIEFTDAAPQPVCNSDTIREPGAPVLGYGGVATWPGTSVTCVMEKFGVTCVNRPANQGFFLAKGRYQIF